MNEPSVEDIKEKTRDAGLRQIADAMDYLESVVQTGNVDDTFDIDQVPLPSPLREQFLLVASFGSALERRYPAARQDEWPKDETEVPI